MFLRSILFFATVFFLCSPAAAESPERLWAALRDGTAIAIMRHELAPGIGDPDNFDVDDCTTQRNLDATGRARAHATGDRFRDNGIVSADVHSSQWCRCLETARLMELGTVRELPPLNSFFENMEDGPEQTAALKEWLAQTHLNGSAGACDPSGEYQRTNRQGDQFRRDHRLPHRRRDRCSFGELVAMADNKTKPTDADVHAYIASVEHDRRRGEAETLVELMQHATGLEPRMWGDSMIGFGRYAYTYKSGHGGEYFLTGFAPRKAAMSIYIMPGFKHYEKDLTKLGPHTHSVSCLYVKRLDAIDLKTLKRIVSDSVTRMKKTYPEWWPR